MSKKHFNLPNMLSAFRLLSALALFGIALAGHRGLFLIILLTALVSDGLDGFLARHLKQTSAFGARIDSYGDIALYTAVPVCMWLLWPDIFIREIIYLLIAYGSYLAPLTITLLKFGRPPTYHTWAAKVAAFFYGPVFFLLLVYDIVAPFRIAAVLQTLVSLEEVLITLRLAQWRDNIPSLWHLPDKTPPLLPPKA